MAHQFADPQLTLRATGRVAAFSAMSSHEYPGGKSIRHGRAHPGHPRLSALKLKEDVDARDISVDGYARA
jgi:hypothetical protein